MKNPDMVSKKIITSIGFIASAILLVFWVMLALRYRMLPLYADSIHTLGAGAKLAYTGHFSSTFMSFGLINPFIIELFLKLGFGGQSYHLIRLVQLLWAILGFIGIGASFRLICRREISIIKTILFTSIICLSSAIILIEAFEPTPEISMFCVLSWLVFASLRYKGSKSDSIIIGLLCALMVGVRPTAFILCLPAILCVANSAENNSYLKKYWIWTLLAAAALLALASIYVSADNLITLAAITVLFLTACTIPMIIIDNKRGLFKGWFHIFFTISIFLLAIVILFPPYIINRSNLFYQMQQIHFEREVSNFSLIKTGNHLFLSIINLWIVFPGPLAAVGISIFSGALLRFHFISSIRKKLAIFILGLIPFILLICKYDNYQPRYLIPLLPISFLFALTGFFDILKRKALFLGLTILPLAFSIWFVVETTHFKPTGGFIQAFEYIEELQGLPVSECAIYRIPPSYFSKNNSITWSLLPYLDESMNIYQTGSEMPEILISSGSAPDGYSVIRFCGVDYFKQSIRSIRSCSNP